VVRRGVPDKFIEHGERNELLADIGLSVDALVALVRKSRAAEEVAKCG
jgi:1-deoxy-D-xylulose-5-phosphate synthase